MATAQSNVVKPDFGAKRKHFIFTEEHEALRESIRNFAIKELAPHAAEWEETTFPSSVFPRMGELGFLGLDKPEKYGGQGGDYYTSLVLAEEITNANSGGLAMGLAVHTDMAMPPILAFGTEEQKQEWVVPAIKGEKILCLGITEPDAGSDVKGIKTRAVKDGDEYVINGSKTYITNGHRAHVIVLVTKTDADAGYDGFTLFLVPMHRIFSPLMAGTTHSCFCSSVPKARIGGIAMSVCTATPIASPPELAPVISSPSTRLVK